MPLSTKIRDLVVVLPGIIGSTLAKNGKPIWAPSAGSVLSAISTFGGSINDLKLPDNIGDDHPHDGVEPITLMPDLHILPGIWSANIGYEKLLDWLRTRFNFVEPSLNSHLAFPTCCLCPTIGDFRTDITANGSKKSSSQHWSDGGPRASCFLRQKLFSSVTQWAAW